MTLKQAALEAVKAYYELNPKDKYSKGKLFQAMANLRFALEREERIGNNNSSKV